MVLHHLYLNVVVNIHIPVVVDHHTMDGNIGSCMTYI